MEFLDALESLHPEGEPQSCPERPAGNWPVDTPGGRSYVEWDPEAPVTREGQLIFFFQFLHVGGRWDEFLRNCPLRYTGNRGSGARNVLGTAMLSVLCGHWRYAHINAVRGDGINPRLLGMAGTVSEDTVRQGIGRIGEKAGLDWLRGHLLASIAPALSLPWILDIDSTVKPLYGRQQGATVGYNPRKPGRPSHVYHSYFVANLRISLGVEIRPGREHAAARGLPGLWQTLEKLPRHRWPTFTRGDAGYGNEAIMLEHEERLLPYLFKLRHTPKVRELVQRTMRQGAAWQECGDGWQAMEGTLRLSGWSRSRRVILVRESPSRAPVAVNLADPGGPFSSASASAGAGAGAGATSPATSAATCAMKPRRRRRGKDRQSQNLLPQAIGEGWDPCATPWSGKIAVLVTSLDPQAHPASAMPRHYRERADAENAFDELKNQWGWGGYCSQRLSSSRLMANLIALVYNWWALYLRFYDQEHHREAIRTRPMLMAAVARQVQSGGQRTVKVSLLHEKGELIALAVTRISNELQHIRAIAERWTADQRWSLLLTRLLRRWLGGKWLCGLPNDAAILLSG